MASQDFPAPTEGSCSPTFMVAKDVARSSDFYTGVLGGEVVTPAPYGGRHSDRSSAATSRPPTSTTGWPGPESPASPRSSTTKPCPEDAEEALRSAHAVARDTAKLKQLGSTNVRK